MDGAVDYYSHSTEKAAKFKGVIWTPQGHTRNSTQFFASSLDLVENQYTQTGTRTTKGRWLNQGKADSKKIGVWCQKPLSLSGNSGALTIPDGQSPSCHLQGIAVGIGSLYRTAKGHMENAEWLLRHLLVVSRSINVNVPLHVNWVLGSKLTGLLPVRILV